MLICDRYGNFFFKKVFSYLELPVKIKLLKSIDIKRVSLDTIGSYPLQHIIENLNTKEEVMIVLSSVKQNLIDLCLNSLGCHVVEKILIKAKMIVPLNLFYLQILDNFKTLAYNPHGIIIIKYMITYVSDKTMCEKLSKLIFENISNLVNHDYGNYIILCTIENWSTSYCTKIANLFLQMDLFKLCSQKFSSNLIEKLIDKIGQVKSLIFRTLFLISPIESWHRTISMTSSKTTMAFSSLKKFYPRLIVMSKILS